MASFQPRAGQWVKFKLAKMVPAGHVTGDGFHVGIFEPASTPSLVTHAVAQAAGAPLPPAAEPTPARVVLVDEDGFNVPKISRGDHLGNYWFELSQVTDLHPVADRKDIPVERIKHLAEDWQPKP